jgi:hypothetical protein
MQAALTLGEQNSLSERDQERRPHNQKEKELAQLQAA